MHNYQVPSKYKHVTRIGNWSEEWELEETRYISWHFFTVTVKRYKFYPKNSLIEKQFREKFIIDLHKIII
jgi:hypothetical protein